MPILPSALTSRCSQCQLTLAIARVHSVASRHQCTASRCHSHLWTCTSFSSISRTAASPSRCVCWGAAPLCQQSASRHGYSTSLLLQTPVWCKQCAVSTSVCSEQTTSCVCLGQRSSHDPTDYHIIHVSLLHPPQPKHKKGDKKREDYIFWHQEAWYYTGLPTS